MHEPLFALECVAWDPSLRRAFSRRVKESAEQLVELRETIVHNGVVEVSEEELARAESLARSIVLGVRHQSWRRTVRGPLTLLILVLIGGGVATYFLTRSNSPHSKGAATAADLVAIAATLSNLGVNPSTVTGCQASAGGWGELCAAQGTSVGISQTAGAGARDARFSVYVRGKGRHPCSPVSHWIGQHGSGKVRCVSGPGNVRALLWTNSGIESVGVISAPTARYQAVRRVFHSLLGVANA
jgi:hypothetical protein